MYNPRRPRGRFFWFPFIALLSLLALGAVVMVLWNFIVSPVFKVGALTYLQAVGLLILCRILFGSFSRSGPSFRHRNGPPWKSKWMQMNPEERERFRQEWQKRCSPKKKPDEEP